MKNSWKKNLSIFMKAWGYFLITSLIIVFSFKSAIAEINVVPTGSMKPTILEGDRIFVNKLAYDLKIPFTTVHIAEWGAPQRGDIAVLFSPKDGMRLVKRVVGIPGDTIEMKNNQLIINGEKLKYEPVGQQDIKYFSRLNDRKYGLMENLQDTKHPVIIHPRHPSAYASFNPIIIPEDKYLMMGDNRDNSSDSRAFGLVDRNKIVGQAISVVISLDINDKYKPRWERFFTRLP